MALLFQFNILGLLRHYSPQYIHIPIILLETTQGGDTHKRTSQPLMLAELCCIALYCDCGSANAHNIHNGIEYCNCSSVEPAR